MKKQKHIKQIHRSKKHVVIIILLKNPIQGLVVHGSLEEWIAGQPKPQCVVCGIM